VRNRNLHCGILSHRVMAGREKVTRRKLDNMGLEEIADACDMSLDMFKKNLELQVSGDDQMTAMQFSNMTPSEYNEFMLGYYRLLVFKLEVKAINTTEELEARQVAPALKYAVETLREMQGDSSLHVEKVKRGASAESMEELLKSLPEAVEAEVTDVQK